MPQPEKIQSPEQESRELPKLSRIYERHPLYGVDLFISGKEGASDLNLLRQNGITTVVNCAVNLDFNFVEQPQIVSDHEGSVYGPGEIRYYKIGLIDGAGNPDTQMVAAHYILRAALEQILPDKPSYPRRERGSVLINCRGGRSRSVAVVALFLHLTLPVEFPTLDDAIDFVRVKRELPENEWFKAPKPVLADAARRAAGWIAMIDAAH
ncbi:MULTISPECIES: dual specificity protein phosphatase [Rhizobium/Agrobacterium group]|uniref:Protein phosphatase n=2 Tax=Rhizobium/Agrobacterium group TaxID=227290 RepID=A0A546XAX1_RHIRH|nr:MULTISPECIES: dual specificity protein phosphatase [Rhizobium/Agrobacterium group]MCZ7465572.1 dual specificity protein phosphatase [Rhizobium rhizogenes]MCZ7471585.1 dual specificity protein phosphatase [Rhizobium rhizogenes]MCZ7482818.1 dual specificity protein phosphatase [Rhizobium rhizogenes]MCZ7487985.1 dual specificity protein phosphatase [Rhizobium rhizogenes]MDA5635079.1 dual specificity protein phosphatase [Agrobacterium sp. ST15.16.024]